MIILYIIIGMAVVFGIGGLFWGDGGIKSRIATATAAAFGGGMVAVSFIVSALCSVATFIGGLWILSKILH